MGRNDFSSRIVCRECEKTMKNISSGIHHVTAIASDAQQNLDFYTGTLGLRLVKLTVNFDDPSSYHFYYGDTTGQPGTLLTFFAWPGARRAVQGRGSVYSTALSIPSGALEYWKQRLDMESVAYESFENRLGDNGIQFADPDGMILELIETVAPPTANVWKGATIPPENAILGIYNVSIATTGIEPTANILTGKLGFTKSTIQDERARFQSTSQIGGNVDVLFAPELPRATQGAGAVHHVAFRADSDDSQLRFRAELVRDGLNVSPVMERNYFRSIYFRIASGVLFEIATDAPGMSIDEPLESLGNKLMLPEQYEKYRAEIEKGVQPIQLPNGGTVGVHA
jgi:glyoxalase family protein